MPVTSQLLHELQAEEWGRVLLSLIGITPVKTKAFHLVVADLGGDDTVRGSFNMDAGTAVLGASLFVAIPFDASTGNAFSLAAAEVAGGLGSGTNFATCDDVGGISSGGTALPELALTTFSAVYGVANWRIDCTYTGTGTPAAHGELIVVVEYATVDFVS